MMLDQALDQGYITIKRTNVTLSGPLATGKSSIMKLLLINKPHVPTSTKSREMKTTSLMSVQEIFKQSRTWKEVDYKSSKIMLAQAIKQEIKPCSFKLSEVEGQSDKTHEQEPSIKTFPRSPSKEEIIQLLPTVQKSNKLYQTHWIDVIDSRGQPAFLDIATSLLHYNLINIITLNLNKKLKDKSEFYFDVKEKPISEPEERQMTHLQLIESSFRLLASRDPPDLPCNVRISRSHKNPCLLVLGTCFNKITESNESLVEKDAILWKKSEQFKELRLCYRESREMVIFPINANGGGEKDIEMANLIHNRISKFYIEAEIPVRWYLFQLDLDQLHKTHNTTIISKSKCLEIGAPLKMDDDDVEAALKCCHDLTIFYYFHDVLRNVVFLHPQPLFDKLFELISISFADAVDYLEDKDIFLPPGAHTKLKTEGTFKRELLNSLSDGFSPLFTADDFLNLMEHVFILVQTNKDEYFFPIALPITADTESVRAPYKRYTDPLVLTWEKRSLPQGLLSQLVANLLNRQHSPQFKFLDPIESPEGFSQYRNAIQLRCISPGGRLLLVDATYWLEVCYSDDSTECPLIRNAIEEGINEIAKKFHYKPIESHPQKQFLCTIPGHPNDHLCCPSKDNMRLTCDVSTSSANIDEARQLPWLHSVTINPNQG